MAKWGEGDERWIVQDRSDGRNVNSWHWVEKDCTDWSKARLKELLNEIKFEQPVDSFKYVFTTDSITSVTGESTVNNRKGKTIVIAELEVKAKWKAEVLSETGESVVSVVGDYAILDTGADTGGVAEVEVTLSNRSTKHHENASGIMRKDGSIAVQKAVTKLLDELRALGPSGTAAPAEPKSKEVKQALNKDTHRQVSSKPVAAQDKEKSPFQTISLTENFKASPDDVFLCLTDTPRVSAFTQRPAKVSANAGDDFMLLDGVITGSNVEMVRGKKIVQDWRMKDWPAGTMSRVDITLEKTSEGTKLKLTQKGVPTTDKSGNAGVVDQVKAGWKREIFQRCKMMFGFGDPTFG
eukprot:Rmarinus@m.7872